MIKTLDFKEISKILPHRYPFLLVDKIVHLDVEKGIVIGQKNVTFNEAFFQGHFPEVPIMPGVLILEALAQTGGVLVHMKLVHLKGKNDKIALLLTVNNAKFRAPVKPGDILILECEEVIISSKAGRIRAKAKVNDKVVVEAEMGFALADKDQI